MPLGPSAKGRICVPAAQAADAVLIPSDAVLVAASAATALVPIDEFEGVCHAEKLYGR
jgi:hypothetical protein